LNLSNTNLYKAQISQTDMSGSYGIKSLAGAYTTGSVNLYNVEPSTQSEVTNPYDYYVQKQTTVGDNKSDIGKLFPHRKSY